MTSTRKVRPTFFLPAELLPVGFEYPESYKAFGQEGKWLVGPTNEDWSVLDAAEVERFIAYTREFSPSRPLVPFMRRNGEDGVACFDGSLEGDEPKVFVVHYAVNEGCIETHKTFGEWLATIPASDE